MSDSSDRSPATTGPRRPTLSPATVAVTAGRPPHQADEPLNTPMTPASTFVAGGDREYGRYGNPTWAAFEEALGALEGGRCLAFSSGLAAVSTVLDLVGHGALVVAPEQSYSGTVLQLGDLESRGRITTAMVDITDLDAVREACSHDPALVWIESPTNPLLDVVEVKAVIDPPTRPVPTWWSTTPSPPRCSSDRSSWGRTSSCTRPRSTSPGTATCCSAPSCAPTRPCATCSRPAATCWGRSPAPWRPGWRCAGCAPCTCVWSAPAPTPPRWPRAWVSTRR